MFNRSFARTTWVSREMLASYLMGQGVLEIYKRRYIYAVRYRKGILSREK